MITNTTAKMTYTFTEGITEYAVGFVYQTNPDGLPQIKVYINDAVNTPLVYGTDYTMSQDGTKVVIASGAEVGDSLTIIRNIPIVQLSDYVVGRIDPEQIENDFDLCVERDQQQSARITVTEEQLAAHDERISDIEEVVPESAATDNLLATVSDIPTDLAELTNSPGYITGITSTDVTTALGYTPYDASNPNGYTANTGTVTSVNNVQPVNGNVTLEFPTAEQSDWAQSDNTKVDYIKNKPTLGTMAAESASDYTPTASLATVATTGDYDDLLDKPTIPTVNDTTITFTQGGATKGTITLNQASAATIAFDAGGGGGGGAVDSVNGYTGVVVLSASDVGALPDSTTIPDAQIQSDWNQSDNTKVDYIKNKPTIPAAQVNADWDAVSGVAQILNKPTIPTVNDSTITITQGGVTKGSFTLNQASDDTIALDAGGGSVAGQAIDAEIVGSPTISDGDVSNLSYQNYLVLPGKFDVMTGVSSFEIVVAFTTYASAISNQNILTRQGSGGLGIRVDNMHIGFWAAQGLNERQNVTGATTLSTNTKYYAKIVYDGTNYILSLSTDGVTYTQEATAVATYLPGQLGMAFPLTAGWQENSSSWGLGAIHMDAWYVKRNGILVWSGMDAPGLHQRVVKGHEVIAFQAPTSTNNYTWYRKYADGWVEQGGYATTSGNTGAQITLPVTMSDAHYLINGTCDNDTTGGVFHFMIYENQTTTGFTASPAHDGEWRTGAFYWEVRGMAAN